jgi:uncharacterized membrane protein YuzA (DUF378 family)
MPQLRGLDWATLIMLILGGLNWLLVGALHYDLIAALFGIMTPGARILYILGGVTTIYITCRFKNLVHNEKKDRPAESRNLDTVP